MNDINSVKKRIKDRKNIKNTKRLNDKNFSKLYNFMIKGMVFLLVLLAVFTYIKTNPEGNSLNNILSNVHLENFKTWINNQFYDFFPNMDYIEVSSIVEYKHIEDNLYTNDTNEVVSFGKGRVIYKGEQELLGNYMVVLLENNIEVTFGKLTDIFVLEYDFVEKGTVIGTYNDNLLIVFSDNGKEIDYETFKKATS